MTAPFPALVAAMAAAVVTGLAVNPVLRRLPEPAGGNCAADGDPADGEDGEDGKDDKIPYADLAGVRFALGCALVSFALGLTSWALLPPVMQAPWTVLATVGVVLALVDLRTTWLPTRLVEAGWVLMLVAVGLTATLTSDRWLLARGLLGALGAAAMYALVWKISRGGFGKGDVYFAPLIGAAAGTHSWALWMWALFLGTFVGGVVGVLRLVRGQRAGFPYAPSILLGGYLALAASAFT